jgi:hypothetical protein
MPAGAPVVAGMIVIAEALVLGPFGRLDTYILIVFAFVAIFVPLLRLRLRVFVAGIFVVARFHGRLPLLIIQHLK